MKQETIRFFLFLFILSIAACALSNYRGRDRIYTFADSGITTVKQNLEPSFFLTSLQSYADFWIDLAFKHGGLTSNGETIYEHIGARLLPTFHLAIFSILFGASLGISLSLLPVYLRLSALDQLLTRIAEVILSTPVFVFAILLLILFFYELDLLPPGGYEPFNTSYVVMPGLALGSRVFSRIYLFQSKEVWKESKSAYSLLLETRGYPWGHIVFTEIFRKVIPLTIVVIILDFGSLLSGAMIVEEIFFFPGIGKSLFFSIKSMDTKLLSTLLLYTGIVFYAINRLTLYWQKYLLGDRNGRK